MNGGLAAAVARLNPDLPQQAVADVVTTVKRAESPLIESENWNAYRLLDRGRAGRVPRRRRAAAHRPRAAGRLGEPDEQRPCSRSTSSRIAGPKKDAPPGRDLLFVNGLPMALFELKRPGKTYAKVAGAFNQIQTYRDQIPDVFKWNQVAVVSDGVEAMAGSFSAPWEHWAPWKTIDGHPDPKNVDGYGSRRSRCSLRGMFRPDVFFDLCRNFVATFGDGDETRQGRSRSTTSTGPSTRPSTRRSRPSETDGAHRRRLAHAGVRQVAGDGVLRRQDDASSRRWRTRRSSSLTDRNDLDDQLFDETFAPSKPGSPLPETPGPGRVPRPPEGRCSPVASPAASSSRRSRSSASPRQDQDAGRKFPLLSDRTNIVVMVDEAHRSNYDLIDGFARHLRDGTPERLVHRVHRHPDRRRRTAPPRQSSVTTSTSTT